MNNKDKHQGVYEIKDWEKLCEPENWHPAASMFPMLGGDEGFRLKNLVDNIQQSGLLNPVVMLNNKVLDGRNRLAACKLASVKPKFVDWDGKGGSPEEWVASQNASRRDLTASQKAYASLYLRKTIKPTKEQKDKFTAGGGKWDSRIYICNMLGIDRHYYSDIAVIEKWANGEPSERWPDPSQRLRPELLEQIKNGLHGIASMTRQIDFWVAQAKNPELTEQQNEECPAGQLMREYMALYPQHILAASHEILLTWLEGEKLARAKRYWERLAKEYTWNTEKS